MQAELFVRVLSVVLFWSKGTSNFFINFKFKQ